MENCFYLPGRLRIKIPNLQRNSALARDLVSTLSNQEGITTIKANPLTGKALIYFEEGKLSLEKLKKMLLVKTQQRQNSESLLAMLKKDEDVFNEGLQVVLSGGLLAVLGIKRLLWGRSAFSQTSLMANLSTATTIITAYPIFSSGLKHLTFRGRITYDFLLTLVALASLFFRENTLGLLIIWLVNLTGFFQTITLKRSNQTIDSLVAKKQTKSWVLANGVEVPVISDDIQPGDVLVTHSGEKILAGGQVLQGQAIVNQGLLTGNLEPIFKKEGDWVLAGTTVEEGSLQILVHNQENECLTGENNLGEGEVLSNPVLNINPLAQLTGDYGRSLMAMSFGMAFLVYLLTRDLTISTSLLVVGSPSPAALALSTAMGASLGNAAKQGVLVKQVKDLETLAQTDTVFFDKTGTVTLGQPAVQKIEAVANYTEKQIIALAAGCERWNIYPLARGIINCARKLEVEVARIDNIQGVVGYGVRGRLEGNSILLGSREFMLANGIEMADYQLAEEGMQKEGLTVVWLALGGQAIGIIGLEDALRTGSRQAVRQLKENGIDKLALITGDNERVADKFAKLLGLKNVLANASPEEKLSTIIKEKEKGRIVTMVGDGFNDCPALTKADIGITVGTTGSDLALQSADIILVDDNLERIKDMLQLSRATEGVIKQNFLLSAAVNLSGFFLALRGGLNPGLASIMNNLATLGIVINSASLLQRKTEGEQNGKI